MEKNNTNNNVISKSIIKAFENAYRDAIYNKKDIRKLILFRSYICSKKLNEDLDLKWEIEKDYNNFRQKTFFDKNNDEVLKKCNSIFKKFGDSNESKQLYENDNNPTSNAVKFNFEINEKKDFAFNEIISFFDKWDFIDDEEQKVDGSDVQFTVMCYINTYLWVDLIGRNILHTSKYTDYVNTYSFSNKLYGVDTQILYSPYFDNFSKFGSVAQDSVNQAIDNKKSIIIFKLDIEKYYESINMEYLIEEINLSKEEYFNTSNVKEKEIYDQIHKIELTFHNNYAQSHENKRGLLIGLESSRIFSEIYGTIIDRLVIATNPLKYARYVDDIVVCYQFEPGKENLEHYIDISNTKKKVESDLDVNILIGTDQPIINDKPNLKFSLNHSKTKRYIITSKTPKEVGNMISELLKKTNSDAHLLPETFNFTVLDAIPPEVFINEKNPNITPDIIIIKKTLGLIKSRIYNIEKHGHNNSITKDDQKVYFGQTKLELDMKVEQIITSYMSTLISINNILSDEIFINLIDYWQLFMYFDYIISEYCGKEELFDTKRKFSNLKGRMKKLGYEETYLDKLTDWYNLSNYLVKNQYYSVYDLDSNAIFHKQLSKINQTLNKGINEVVYKELENVNEVEKVFGKEDKIKYNSNPIIKLNKIKSKIKLNKTNSNPICDSGTIVSKYNSLIQKNDNNTYKVNFLLEQIPVHIQSMEDYSRYTSTNYEEKTKSYEYLHNNLLKSECDILIMPELCMKWENIYDYTKLAMEKECVIISGLEYKINDNIVLNILITIIPLSLTLKSVEGEILYKYKDAVLHFRNKFHYSPEEKRMIEGCTFNGKKLKVPVHSKKFTIPKFKLTKYLTITSFNCFELYDISLRNSIDSSVSLVTAHEWNKDIEVFEKLSRSVLTDKKVFLAQSNYTNYGDIGLFQPKGNFRRDIIKIKGGVNTMHIYDKIDVEDLFYARTSEVHSKNNNYKPSPPGMTWTK